MKVKKGKRDIEEVVVSVYRGLFFWLLIFFIFVYIYRKFFKGDDVEMLLFRYVVLGF